MKTNSREFFIDGKTILIRPLIATDLIADQHYADFVEKGDTVTGELSFRVEQPLGHYGHLDTEDSSVYVAVRAAQEKEGESHTPKTNPMDTGEAAESVGFGLYIRNPVTLNHEFSVVVRADFGTTRLPLELIDSLVLDAADNSVQTLTTNDSNTDTLMQYIAKKLGMSSRLDTAKFRHTRYTLQVDKHPGIVTF